MLGHYREIEMRLEWVVKRKSGLALVQKVVQYLEEYYAVLDIDTSTCMPRPQ